MPWLRVIQWDFSFDCCYEGNTQLSKTPYYRNRRHITKFIKRPTDDLEVWAREKAEKLSLDRADYACQELQAKFSGCMIELLNFRYSEVLVPEIRVRVPTGEEIRLPPRRPMKIELDQLALLEKDLAEEEEELAKHKRNLYGANQTILSFKGEVMTPEVKIYVNEAKGARNNARRKKKRQIIRVEQFRKAVEDYKTKIGFVE